MTGTDDHPPHPVPDEPHQHLARAIGAASAGERPTAEQLVQILQLVGRSARAAGSRAVTSGRWLTEVTLEAATHVPVRSLPALLAHHDGKHGPILADALVRNATLATGAVGAATGALAAASQAHPATWVTLPAEVLVETLLVVSIEMKLVGELHEVAGIQLPGNLSDKGQLIARSWADSRGIRPADLAALATLRTGGISQASASFLGRQARDQLIARVQRRLVARTGRNLSSLLPFLTGAVVGGTLNRRATQRLGDAITDSLGLTLHTVR